MNDQATTATQTSDPYDGILPVLEARAEAHRVQETVSEAMKALETDPELATVQAAPSRPLEPGYAAPTKPLSDLGRAHSIPGLPTLNLKRRPHCQDCSTGLLRIIRNADDTVRHVNGEKCKRFHAS